MEDADIMEKLTLENIASILVNKNGLSKEAAELFANQMFAVVREGIDRDKIVKVKGLGTFKIVDVEARESINVNTGERVLIEGHGKISFTPDPTMKELVNKPFSQFETVVLNDGVTFDDMPADEEEEEKEEEEQPQQEQQQEETRQQEQQEEETREQEQQEEEEQKENPAESTSARTFEQSSNRTPDYSRNRGIEESNNRPQEAALEAAPQEAALETTLKEAAPQETAPQEESSPLQQDEPEAAGHEDNEDSDEEESSSSDATKWIVAAVISFVLIVLAACGGYIYGLNKGRAEAKEILAETQDEKPAPQPQSQDSLLAALHPEEPVVLDTTKAETPKEEAAPKAESTKKAEETKPAAEQTPKQDVKPKAEPKQESKKQAETKVEASSKYEQMDARVRTGAYRIVGVDRTVTVKKGETLKRISKTYLGEGMECYVEVLNGLSGNQELKEGSKLKIPKLELKKRNK